MLKFWEFSNFLENSHFFSVHTPSISLLDAIFPFGSNLAKRNDDDAPQKRTILRQVRAFLSGALPVERAFLAPGAQGRFPPGQNGLT